MKWGFGGLIVISVLLVWYVSRMERRVELSSRVGWSQVCWHAPHQRMTPSILEGLREARVQVGLKGWHPTVAWVNEQCAALGMN